MPSESLYQRVWAERRLPPLRCARCRLAQPPSAPSAHPAAGAWATAACAAPDEHEWYGARTRCAPRAQYYQGFPEFKRRRADLAARALDLLRACEPLARRASRAAAGKRAPLEPAPAADALAGAEDEEELDERAAALAVEVADDCLERADRALDAAADARDAATALPPARALLARRTGAGAAGVGGGEGFQRYSASLPRPQDRFPSPVDNSNAPFAHRPAGRPGAAVPAGVHPYAAELEALVYTPAQLEAPEPREPPPLNERGAVWVDTPGALDEMAAALRGAAEVAVDLEHHSYRWGEWGLLGGWCGWGGGTSRVPECAALLRAGGRGRLHPPRRQTRPACGPPLPPCRSFQGFTCLVQVSTRDRDWVVDALALRGQLGAAVAGVMADPSVVKVLHGADRDILWLQVGGPLKGALAAAGRRWRRGTGGSAGLLRQRSASGSGGLWLEHRQHMLPNTRPPTHTHPSPAPRAPPARLWSVRGQPV